MCKNLKNFIKIIETQKYAIIIVILFIILIFCIIKIHLNFVNYDEEKVILFENMNTIYTTILIGLITSIGIVFNLRDNDKLRKEQEKENNLRIEREETEKELYLARKRKRNINIKILIKTEIFNNFDILRELSSGMDFGKTNIIQKPNCTINAWKSCYNELPSIFNEDELKTLVEAYFALEKLLDDKNWLNPPKGEPQDAMGEIMEIQKPLTNYNFETIQNNKIHISKMIDEILDYEENLHFLEEKN